MTPSDTVVQPWTHIHSRFSLKDALPTVDSIADRAAELNYTHLALTDHGNMGGVVRLYTECRKRDIEPVPGVEAYVTYDRIGALRPKSFHMILLALNYQGYLNLVRLVNDSMRNFRYKPLIDMADLAAAFAHGRLEGIACTTSCISGVAGTLIAADDDTGLYNVLITLARWFNDRFFIEAQNHDIVTEWHDDAAYNQRLFKVANELGLPMILAQDSHYLLPEHQPIHDTYKQLVSWSNDSDDAKFDGGPYHIADWNWLVDNHTEEVLEAGREGLLYLQDLVGVRIPQLENFKLSVPDISGLGQPDTELEMLCKTALGRVIASGGIPKSKEADYYSRMQEELDVLQEAGFSGYILFVRAVTNYIRSRGIFFAIRGSASGSLVCWLTDITQFDPIKWDLRFDRFLSRDRMKPPDIDIDVDGSRRQEVVDWLANNFRVTHIGTWAQVSMEKDFDDTDKGSLIKMYYTWRARTGLPKVESIPPEDFKALAAIESLGSKAKKRAPYISTGKGAAGLLVTASPEDDAVVPLVWIASSGTLVTALDKDDVERLGLLKLDFLGLKTYTALAEMIESTGVDLGTINFSNSAVYRMLSKGETTGVFQLEGKASMYGTKRLRPTKFGDLIAAMALFRPATMDSGATEDYIARKHKKQDVPQRHPILMDGTKDTYGVLLYQEQALDIFRNLGMTIEEIEKARKAIKASNENIGNAKKTLAELLIRVEALAREAGMNDEDYAWLQRALEAFAGYSFNRAHATGYAANAYITAWFKIYHPLEFWCAMLNAFDATEDQTKFTKAARAAKVKILPPHVNVPSLGYVVDYEATAIRRGLVSITGVGEKAAQAIIDNSPYVSVVDLATRANHRAVSGRNAILQGHTTTAAGGTIGALADDGALDDLPLGEVEKRVTKRRKAAGSPDQIALLDEDARREGDV